MLLPMGYDVPDVVASEVMKRCAEMRDGVYHATAYKIELEAQFGRLGFGEDDDERCNECDDGLVDCPNDDCDDGWVGCETCEQQGVVTDPNDATQEITCTDCDGEGSIRCPEEGCDDGYVRCSNECDEGWIHYESEIPAWGHDRVCLEYILDEVASKLGVEWDNSAIGTMGVGMHNMAYVKNPIEGVSFAGFYNDGSVDSEMTVTIDIDKPFIGMEFLAAWKKMGEAIGNGMDTDGAGMHIAILNSQNGTYPDGNSLHPIRAKNFQVAMERLMPALFFLSSCDWKSRALRFRMPRVTLPNEYGYDNQAAKYAAVSGWKNCFEYRVFETCYNKPQALLDYLIVIAKTLRYYRITPKKLQWFGTIGDLGMKDGRGVNRFFYTTKHLQALDAGLKALKPTYKDIDTLKRERNFRITPERLAHKELKLRCALTQQYREYVDRMKRSEESDMEAIKRDWKNRREMNEIPRMLTLAKYMEKQGIQPRTIKTLEQFIKEKTRIEQNESTPMTVRV